MTDNFLLKSQMSVVAQYREVLEKHQLDPIERDNIKLKLKNAEARLERWTALSVKK